MYNVALWLLHLGESYKPLGKEEKIQTGKMTNWGVAWLPDSSEFVFASGTGTASGFGGLHCPRALFPGESTLTRALPPRRPFRGWEIVWLSRAESST
jgi:hypothetical protein